jgi:YggT family protein
VSPPQQALGFLVELAGTLAVLFLLLRVLLQVLDADYYNPISQAVARVTTPVLRPLRRLVPSSPRVNGPALVLLVAAQLLELYVLAALHRYVPALSGVLLMTLAQLLWVLALLYIGLLIARAVASWFPGARGPALHLVAQLTEPLLAPVRRALPAAGGLDWSVLIVLVAIELARILALRPLLDAAQVMMVQGL